MKTASFTPAMDNWLRREYPACRDPRKLARRMGVSYVQLKNRAYHLRVARLRTGGPDRLPQPTDALPGSDAKMAVLAQRLTRGERLWHPADAAMDLE